VRTISTWSNTAGWYGSGLRPSGNCPNHQFLSLRTNESAEGANHISLGQRPRNRLAAKGTRAEGPLYRLKRLSCSAGSETRPTGIRTPTTFMYPGAPSIRTLLMGATRRVHRAGCTSHSAEAWLVQVGRNPTDPLDRFLRCTSSAYSIFQTPRATGGVLC
jgi:hypothetical protein